MIDKRLIHISMMNSFNLITDRATIEDIIKSGLGVFAHVPDERLDIDDIEFMIDYFSTVEMFEECAELSAFINDTFNEDGTLKEAECECELPSIKSYTRKVKCNKCNKLIIK
jgi:hypothetical protein